MTNQPWTAERLRHVFVEFFRQRGHTVIPSASLIPEHDPTVLFTTAGMHPLVPYLLGEPHPGGKRLVNVQRCFRTSDIDEVGDGSHLTFFEMLGNWSLGDYFKKEAIEWSWEFLTSPDWLALPPEKLSVSVFAGDADAVRDEESADLWRSVGVPAERIFYFGKEKNWWGPAGETGPCGPDTEMFYDFGTPCTLRPPGKCDPSCDCGRYVEIWNDVFMQYSRNTDGTFSPLKQKNVDTGMGLERMLAILQRAPTVYETDAFAAVMEPLRRFAPNADARSLRILADHLRSSVMLLADGVVPSNKERGYVLRRLIRKTVRESQRLSVPDAQIQSLVSQVISQYREPYPHVGTASQGIIDEFKKEALKFQRTLTKGLKILQKERLVSSVADEQQKEFSGTVAFDLYQTYGFPKELIQQELGTIPINEKEWAEAESVHRTLSRKGAEQKFHGGLADTHERTIRMHTATHLLHQALRDVLGSHVFQKGSNITQERLRFDFSHPDKLTSEQIAEVERIVNENVAVDLPVHFEFLTVPDARAAGAIGLFDEKYEEKVKVYFIGDYSREFCGGPHVEHTKQVGRVRILKEEAIGAGIRRIKAVVDDTIG